MKTEEKEKKKYKNFSCLLQHSDVNVEGGCVFKVKSILCGLRHCSSRSSKFEIVTRGNEKGERIHRLTWTDRRWMSEE